MEYLQYFKPKINFLPIAPTVLNLVISGIPSILKEECVMKSLGVVGVLNLVISGIPSIRK